MNQTRILAGGLLVAAGVYFLISERRCSIHSKALILSGFLTVILSLA